MPRDTADEGAHGLDYASLEAAISKLHTFGGKKEFDAKLQAQVASCNKYYMSMIQDLNLANYPTSDQVLTEAVPAKLAADILKLDQFGHQNAQILQAILTLHDKRAEFPLMHSYQWKMQRNDFCSSDALEPLLMRLSSQYVTLKKQETREEKRDPGGVSTTVFERKSIKFWIRSHDVVKVICDIVKKMPIHSYGKLNRFSQYTTSVYYDDENLNMYSQRLVKEENSTLIRFRWYNDMTKDTNVFVERKVHHEKWVLEASNKMRFVLPQGNILGFVNGTFHSTPEFVQKHPMFTEVQDRIVKEHLQPCLQTRYYRAAFQMDDDDSVRLSLDTNLMMLQESGVDMTKAWRRQENSYLEDDVHRFPFAVLEVKLHMHLLDNPPPWINELMEGGMLIRVDKFSKYGHGVAVLYNEKVKTLPYWLDQEFSKQISEGGRGDADRQLEVARMQPPTIELHATNQPPLPVSTNGYVRPRQPTRSIFDEAASNSGPGRQTRGSTIDQNRVQNKGGLCGCFRRRFKSSGPKIESRLRIEPKTYFANERTYMQWFMTSIVLGGLGVTYLVSPNPTSRTLGRVMLPIAIALACYSLLVFHWRIYMLLRRQPSGSYGDRCGPTGLSLAFLAVLIWGVVVTVPGFIPVPPAISAFCTNRMCAQMDRCTLPVILSTPPKQDFAPSGMTGVAESLYITSTDGRIGVVNPSTHAVTVWNNYWLSPGTPTFFAGVASMPGHPRHVYGLRALPTPAILEIEIFSRRVKRTFDLDLDSVPTGLAIAPGRGNYVAYVPARDGRVWVYDVSLVGNESISKRHTVFIPGNLPIPIDIPALSVNATKKPPAFLAQYNQGQVIIINDKVVYVYNTTDEGKPISTSSYQAYSFGIPDTRGLAFISERAYLVTQDDEGGRDSARVMDVEYDHDLGFGFCR